jgi:hypothetical protein
MKLALPYSGDRLRLIGLFLIAISLIVSDALVAAPQPFEGIDTGSPEGDEVLQRYLVATQKSRSELRGVTMRMTIEARLPSMDKQGVMTVERNIAPSGQVSFEDAVFEGDDTIKKDVIARYLQAEAEASQKPAIGLTPENYKFKYYGRYGSGDWQLHLFEIDPKEDRADTFRGWLWIEATTALAVREQGRLAKNPSIWLRRVSFIRDYRIRDGVAVPVAMESTVETRIAGNAEIAIEYSDLGKLRSEEAAVPKRGDLASSEGP